MDSRKYSFGERVGSGHVCSLRQVSQINAPQRTATHCNVLQHTATHCNTLQCPAMHCNALQCTATYCNALQHCFGCGHACVQPWSSLANRCTATRCNALQHTVIHCNTLHRTATNCNALQYITRLLAAVMYAALVKSRKKMHCTLQYTAMHCNALRHCFGGCHACSLGRVLQIDTLQHTAILCNTLQHTETHCKLTHCNTLRWRRSRMQPSSSPANECRPRDPGQIHFTTRIALFENPQSTWKKGHLQDSPILRNEDKVGKGEKGIEDRGVMSAMRFLSEGIAETHRLD